VKSVAAVLISVLFVLCSFGPVMASEGKQGAEAQALAAIAPPEKPPEERVTGNGSIAFLNKYIFRGYELSRSSLVIQPALSASFKGFGVTLWGNIDTDAHESQSYFPAAHGKEGHKWFNESDLTLSYTYAFKNFSLTGGYIYYNTKFTEETEEFFIGIGLDVPSKPTLTIYQDINAYPGTYVNLGVAHSFEVWKERGVTLDLGASAAYFTGRGKYWRTWEQSTSSYSGEKYGAFHDGMVKVGLTVPVTKAFSIQPLAQYWFPLSGKAKKKYGAASYNPNGYLDDNVVYGATFTLSF
jgi:hypothetical protein